MIGETPLGGFRFIVSLDPSDAHLPPAQALLVPLVAAGGFQECRGLSADLEVLAHPEGGLNDYVHQLPVRHTWGRISLKRGLVRDQAMWGWYQAGLRRSLGARRDGAVIALNEAGLPAMAWTFRGGLAVKWSGPEFAALNAAVAVEGLEIAHQGIEQIVLLPPLPGL
ncbi:phage tail protein [Pyxidicoccus xibeiensis]|uniref:phage tail protein n=1 Tax=Pyxidicoccus xibeiensis TaxID=2906759 RepID=UPI0020A7DD25|nr:phage tail protein [Pyxidicoccus xibeiensis]MCP3143396.1 phage tail protein [Pyxidicoccus xibeiensis]